MLICSEREGEVLQEGEVKFPPKRWEFRLKGVSKLERD